MDLASGDLRPAEMPGLHDNAVIGTIGEAVWLSPQAAHLAFRP